VGTYAIRGKNLTNKVVDEALAAGYRLFDSAHLYQNEKDLGEAFQNLLSKHGLTRSDIFITTKFCKLNWKFRKR
jgi:diketogulonate reductase-like aldo/keto reductase